MSYGSVRQYRYRMAKMIARGETFPMSVSCSSCCRSEFICEDCRPFEDEGSVRIDATSNTNYGTAAVRLALSELVR